MEIVILRWKGFGHEGAFELSDVPKEGQTGFVVPTGSLRTGVAGRPSSMEGFTFDVVEVINSINELGFRTVVLEQTPLD